MIIEIHTHVQGISNCSKITLDEITSVANLEDHNVLKTMAFPNPLSSSTTIKFTSTESQFYTISIFNMSGMMIKTLYNNYLDQGPHEFNFDASQLPSGVYLCNISTEDQSIQSQIKLVKY